MPRNQQNNTERHKEVNQWIFFAPGKQCRFDTHLDNAFFSLIKRACRSCIQTFGKDLEKSELNPDCEQSHFCSKICERLRSICEY